MHQPRDSGQPFAAARRLLAAEIVNACAGMGVDDAKRRRLLLQIGQDADQHDVLDDVGEVAGMEGVAIVHDGFAERSLPGRPCESGDLSPDVSDEAERSPRKGTAHFNYNDTSIARHGV